MVDDAEHAQDTQQGGHLIDRFHSTQVVGVEGGLMAVICSIAVSGGYRFNPIPSLQTGVVDLLNLTTKLEDVLAIQDAERGGAIGAVVKLDVPTDLTVDGAGELVTFPRSDGGDQGFDQVTGLGPKRICKTARSASFRWLILVVGSMDRKAGRCG